MPPRKKPSPSAAALEEEKLKAQRAQELLEQKARNIERIKAEARQISLRTAILSDSVQSFDNLLHKERKQEEQKRDEDEWQKYLKCEDLPNSEVPSEMRTFVYKWLNSLNDHWEQQVNWWLKCDDRSVLTQAPEVQDVRRKLTQKLREPIGKFYDKKLRLLIKVYNSLLETIRRRNVSPNHYEDLLTIRDDLRETSFKFLDVLTFAVLLHIDREMVSVNALTANYSFTSPDFIKFIWSFKDVPLPKSYNDIKLINMDPLNMNVTISNRLDLSSSSVRGLWFKLDFLSDYCQSFNSPEPMKFIDLAKAVSEEMKIRKAMTEKQLERMRKEREDFDLMMENKRKEEEANKSKKRPPKNPPKKAEKKSSKSKSKVQIVEKVEPPVVDESTYVDVEDEYLAYEEAQTKLNLEPFRPENLGLTEHEVNMRNFQVTNGVFKIECFERPSQTQEINFQMFLRLHERPNIIKFQHFHHVYQPPQETLKKDERKSKIGKKVIDAKQEALADLIKVEVKLSSKVFWWECPNVCRWEAWEESEEFASLGQEMQNFNLHFDEYVEKEERKLFSAPDPKHYKKPKDVIDFDLTSSTNDVKVSELLKNYVVPSMPCDFDFFDDKLRIHDEKRREWNDIQEIQEQKGERKMSEEEFNKMFEMKSSRPRELFPVQHLQLLNIKENPEIAQTALDVRKKLREQPKKFDEEERDRFKMLKNEPMMLSELLQEIAAANRKVLPVFQNFKSRSSEIKDQKKEIKGSSNIPVKTLRISPSSRVEVAKPVKSKGSKSSVASSKVSFVPTEDTSKELPEESTDSNKKKEEASSKQELKLVPHHRGKWSTRDIYEQSYDAETKTVTFFTGRLGTFAFATRKYSNFPLKTWEIYPEVGDTEKFVVLKLEAQNVNIEFKITNDGYTFKIFFSKKFAPQEIQSPVKVNELKKILSSLNLNLFPEVDGSCYVENNCDKHKPMEFHTYKSMAVYCLSHNFKSNVFNRWAHRRVAIFDSRMILKKSFQTIHTTPLMTASVNVREKFTELEVVELDYEMNPMEQEFRPDLLNFLDDEVDTREHRANLKNSMMIWFVQALLMNVQPLSFSV